jgi:signal transduction histidine kinase
MNSITVMVSDSGADLSTPRHTPRREGGLGLEGLRQSVETLDGSFEVRSQADGTHVSATISIIAQ